MRLKRVVLENFRCFETLTLELHPRLTVLIAENSGGKTTLLDAARAAVWPFVKAFDLGSQTGKSAAIQIEDVRRIKDPQGSMEPVLPARITATGFWNADPAPEKTWTLTREKLNPRTNTLHDAAAKELTRYGEALQKKSRDAKRSEPVDLPLIAYQGTGRLWYQGRYTAKARDRKLDQGVYSRIWGYRDCLSASSSYKQFEDWFVWNNRSYMEQKLGQMENAPFSGQDIGRFENAVQVVQTAINTVVENATGWRDLTYRASLEQQLAMVHPEHGWIPLSLLSDGLRNTVAMVADIAFRCIRLNPHMGAAAAEKTRGIAMIDEVDMFLHPAWQQTIVSGMQRAFPEIQFIVTTHSPQVLTTVSRESIRVLRQVQAPESVGMIAVAQTPDLQSRGIASADVLAGIMNIDPIPRVTEAEWLSDYRALIQAGAHETEKGLDLRQKLAEHFGENHQVILECDRMIRLADMQRRLRFHPAQEGK